MIGRLVLLVGVVGILLAAPPSHAADTVAVDIVDYQFSPAELKVRVGTTVTWTNTAKRTSHSVMFLGPGGYESDRLFSGESFSRTFDKPGSYPYRCGPHEEMTGRIEVTE
ncbi:MAG TPA: plastocyanin/azurin family copper-binding protein [Rhodocyclaceae bacterium]|nr:plastocyanin/azurin family copper-binding protein [Rhodocyclaceae bacterium]